MTGSAVVPVLTKKQKGKDVTSPQVSDQAKLIDNTILAKSLQLRTLTLNHSRCDCVVAVAEAIPDTPTHTPVELPGTKSPGHEMAPLCSTKSPHNIPTKEQRWIKE
jgi:hypothetical protein